jgi:hypothetical protein
MERLAGYIYLLLTKGTKRVKIVILSSKLGSAKLSSYKMFQIRLSEQLAMQLFKCLLLQEIKASVSLWQRTR